MFDDMITNFNLSSSSFCSDDEYSSDRMNNTRLVWITNYKTDIDLPIHVSMDDPVVHLNSSIKEQTSVISNTDTLLNHIQTIDLSKLNLDDLLILLYRLQQKATQHSVMNSPSSSTSSSSSFSQQNSIVFQDCKRSSHRPIHCQSSFTLSNIADAPKQLTTTLTKSISSFHSSSPKHIHSPNDVVNKLLQSYNQRPRCTYQQCQQHKANLVSRLLSFKMNN